jgi:hypothetical protein
LNEQFLHLRLFHVKSLLSWIKVITAGAGAACATFPDSIYRKPMVHR